MGANRSSATTQPPGPAEERLDSWKEIAVYFNRGVTTVQRWERDEGLPVHRQQHDALGSVYAYKSELEAWRVTRAVRTDADEPSHTVPPATPKRTRFSQLYPYGFVIGGLLIGAAIGAIGQRASRPDLQKPVRRLTIVPPSSAPMELSGTDRTLTITSDGSRIVYVGGPGGSRLFVRPLDQRDVTAIAGVGSPRHPFTSPDGSWIGFFDGNTLKKVPITGGPPTTLVEGSWDARDSPPTGDATTPATRRLGSRGAAWGPDNRITFALEGRLLRVSADGGKTEALTSPNSGSGEAAYCWPEYLPDGIGLLFTILPHGDWSEKGSRGSIENAQVGVFDLRTNQQKVLLEGGSHARYVDSGHLIYASGGAIKAVRFDLRTLSIVGTPKEVVPQVATTNRGAANFDVARDGTLVYAPGGLGNDLVRLVWVDRQGREDPLETPTLVYRHPRLSPDGTRLALDTTRDLGIWDFSARTLSWFGVGPASQTVWTPDGRHLIFASTRKGPAELSWQLTDGSEAAIQLTQSPHNLFPNSISPDGKTLVLREDAASPDLMMFDIARGHRLEPLVQTPFRELNADFSADGQFLTYQSNESGQDEVYVQPFPIVGTKRWMISSGGGRQPMWSNDGRELFYITRTGGMMSVPIRRQGGGFAMGAPTKLFEGHYYFGVSSISGRTYDISPRDGRFLLMKSVSERMQSATEIEVVLNWFEELKHTLRN